MLGRVHRGRHRVRRRTGQLRVERTGRHQVCGRQRKVRGRRCQKHQRHQLGLCQFGTDCTDCGVRLQVHPSPPPPPSPSPPPATIPRPPPPPSPPSPSPPPPTPPCTDFLEGDRCSQLKGDSHCYVSEANEVYTKLCRHTSRAHNRAAAFVSSGAAVAASQPDAAVAAATSLQRRADRGSAAHSRARHCYGVRPELGLRDALPLHVPRVLPPALAAAARVAAHSAVAAAVAASGTAHSRRRRRRLRRRRRRRRPRRRRRRRRARRRQCRPRASKATGRCLQPPPPPPPRRRAAPTTTTPLTTRSGTCPTDSTAFNRRRVPQPPPSSRRRRRPARRRRRRLVFDFGAAERVVAARQRPLARPDAPAPTTTTWCTLRSIRATRSRNSTWPSSCPTRTPSARCRPCPNISAGLSTRSCAWECGAHAGRHVPLVLAPGSDHHGLQVHHRPRGRHRPGAPAPPPAPPPLYDAHCYGDLLHNTSYSGERIRGFSGTMDITEAGLECLQEPEQAPPWCRARCQCADLHRYTLRKAGGATTADVPYTHNMFKDPQGLCRPRRRTRPVRRRRRRPACRLRRRRRRPRRRRPRRRRPCYRRRRRRRRRRRPPRAPAGDDRLLRDRRRDGRNVSRGGVPPATRNAPRRAAGSCGSHGRSDSCIIVVTEVEASAEAAQLWRRRHQRVGQRPQRRGRHVRRARQRGSAHCTPPSTPPPSPAIARPPMPPSPSVRRAAAFLSWSTAPSRACSIGVGVGLPWLLVLGVAALAFFADGTSARGRILLGRPRCCSRRGAGADFAAGGAKRSAGGRQDPGIILFLARPVGYGRLYCVLRPSGAGRARPRRTVSGLRCERARVSVRFEIFCMLRSTPR